MQAGIGCQAERPNLEVNEALLPRTIRLHQFTGTRIFGESSVVQGIEARVELEDHFGDPAKAFGVCRFEMFRYLKGESDPRGKRIGVWQIDLNELETNRQYWDGLSQTYKFLLQCKQPVPLGERYVLRVYFLPQQGQRLMDERVFLAGE